MSVKSLSIVSLLVLSWIAVPAAADETPPDSKQGHGTVPDGHAMPFPPWMVAPGHPMTMHPATPAFQPHAYNPWAANPWASMINPFVYGQWMNAMSNPWVNQMTHHMMLDAMMRSMDPSLMFESHAPGEGEGEGAVPEQLPLASIPGFPTQTKQEWRPNTVTGSVSMEAKRKFFQSMMMTSPLSMRDMVGIMAEKMPVSEDVSFDDAVEAMKLRANEVNFKLVGHNPFWKDVEAITGESTPRVEIFQFCDAIVGRKILDYVPEFVVFLPCRIALLEDADAKLWVMTLDWDVSWLDYAQNPNSHLDKGLRQEAKRIRDAMRYIMEGAATGDF